MSPRTRLKIAAMIILASMIYAVVIAKSIATANTVAAFYIIVVLTSIALETWGGRGEQNDR